VDWYRRIDGYCERAGPEFWAEPLNAASNAAFLVTAIVSLALALRAGRFDGPVVWLVALTATIGTGSFLFHTYATVWAAIADTGPISLFILSYFAIAMNRFAGLARGRSIALTLAFVAAMWIVSWALRVTVGPYLGGSQSYFPALLAMLGVGLWLRGRGLSVGAWLLAAASLFAVSLTFRTIDQPLCGAWPAGTHFLWHLLNAVVLGTLTLAVVRHGRLPQSAPSHT
jgi:hypothetical protein